MENEKLTTMKLLAPAKINLFLEVVDKRIDDYHNIRTIFHKIGLFDELTLEEADEGIELTIEGASLPAGHENIVYRAAEGFKNYTNIKKGVRIHLKKNIPVAAGLGGGSSDAASALLGLTRFWGVNISFDELLMMARDLGADVPFFLSGPAALGLGKGDELYPLNPIEMQLLIVNPCLALSTASIYKRYDSLKETKMLLTKYEKDIKIKRFIQGNITVENIGGFLYNDLEAVVIDDYPVIRELKEALIRQGAAGSLMSGSGSTVFGVFLNEKEAVKGEVVFEKKGYKVWITKTLTDR
ncbi:MAG: 4-(cytidine 5'-diphospho)-2-C-methyl-D-erythritol kinase [Nitrospirota bacterium]